MVEISRYLRESRSFDIDPKLLVRMAEKVKVDNEVLTFLKDRFSIKKAEEKI